MKKVSYGGQVVNRVPEPGQEAIVHSVCAKCGRPVKLEVIPEFADAFRAAPAAQCSVCKKGSRWERIKDN